MKSIISTITAAMIVTASFAGAAFAEGDYYNGTSKAQATSRADGPVDNVHTGSIEQTHGGNQSGQPIFGHTSRDNR